MKPEEISVDSISPDPANVRLHPEKNIETIKASLRRFGQQVPILIDSKNVIRKGNGTYQAAREIGWKKIWVLRSDLEGIDLTAFAIADNRSSDTAEWADKELMEQLKSLGDDLDLAEIGFDEDDFKALSDRVFADDLLDDDGTDPDRPEDDLSVKDTFTFQVQLGPKEHKLAMAAIRVARQKAKKTTVHDAFVFIVTHFMKEFA